VPGKIGLEGVTMGRRRAKYQWDAGSVRALRKYLGLTQQEMAEELGTRQQTISEWETGMYRPRGGMNRLLTLVADGKGFDYQVIAAESSSEGESEEEEKPEP
jgi:DNA-binding XRE family transcriptional regulator